MSAPIRVAEVEDAETIAALNLACWRESYDGLVPPQIMEERTLAERRDFWRAALGVARERALLAFGDEGEAVGFSAWRPHDIAFGRLGRGAEISAVYLLGRAQRRGLGRAMVARMAREMREQGLRWASLVVLRDNLPARRFYEALGGRRFGRETLWRGVPQVAYGWRDLSRLSAHQ